MRYTGYWNTVGQVGFSFQGGYGPTAAIAVYNGTPYVAYSDFGSGEMDGQATVWKFDGSSWVTVGLPAFSRTSAYMINILFDNTGSPLVKYSNIDNGDGKVNVQKFDGNSWNIVGNTEFSAGDAVGIAMVVDSNGTPYVMYSDGVDSARITVQKYVSGNWITLGFGLSTGNINGAAIALDPNGNPWVAFQDLGSGDSTFVTQYSGGSWNMVTPPSVLPSSYFQSMVIDNTGVVFIAIQDTAFYGTTVMRYNGTAWDSLSNPGYNGLLTINPNLALDASGTL
jgi:hypothetical protein